MPLTGTRRDQRSRCTHENRRHSLKPLKQEKWPTLQAICALARDHGRVTGYVEVIPVHSTAPLLPDSGFVLADHPEIGQTSQYKRFSVFSVCRY
jgi:hypothetical protein